MRILFTTLILFISITIFYAQPALNMTVLDSWDDDTLAMSGSVQYNDVWGYVDCDGGEYGILGSASKVHFLDLSDPTNIVEIESFIGGDTTVWRDMKTYHDRAYAVSDFSSEGLMVFDLSDLPGTVTKSNQITDYFGAAHNIYIDEPNGRLYVVGANTQNGGVIIFDLTADPDNPTLLSAINLPANPNSGAGYVHDIYVRDNVAYCSHGNLGFFIWDLNDPTTPILLASQNTGAYNHSSWVSEDGSFAIYAEEVPTGRPLGVMDLTQMSVGAIEIDLTFKFPLLANDNNNTPHNPFLRGDLLFCSYYEDGLQVFDVSDPLNPQQVAYYDTYPDNTTYNGYNGNWGAYPFLPSGRILASDIVSGLFVLELDASIPIANIDPPSTADVSNSLPMVTSEICSGDSVVLSLPTGIEKYTWMQDGVVLSESSNELVVYTSGTYSAIVANRGCQEMSNETIVEVKPSADFTSVPTTNIQECLGEVIVVEIPDGYDSYDWLKDGTSIGNSNTLTITESGTYQVASTLNGCSSISPAFVVDLFDLPTSVITPQGPTEFCQGNFLNLNASTDATFPVYTWTSDSLTFDNVNQIQVTSSGTYTLNILDDMTGCSSSTDVDITVYQPVIPTIAATGNTIESSAANFYQWYLNGVLIPNANGQTIEITSSGDYHVATQDDNGCFATSMPLTVDFTSTNELKEIQSISIFPNPVKALLQINLEIEQAGNYQLEIINTNGKVLLEKNQILQTKDEVTFNTSLFPAGIYFVKIKNENGQLVRKFVKI